MADEQKYYVAMHFEYGKQAADGTRAPENPADIAFLNLNYDEYAYLLNLAVIPSTKLFLDESSQLALDTVELNGGIVPEVVKAKKAAGRSK